MQKLTRTLQGKVMKISGDKTISVEIESKQAHPIYGKVVRTHTKYLAHTNDSSKFEIGQIVTIAETKPISKNKSWKVIDKPEVETK